MTNDNLSFFDPSQERLRRWRLILGDEADGIGFSLRSETDLGIDRTLATLYSHVKQKGRGGLDASAPYVARWLGDIRTYFPASVVHILQKDALERLNLRQLLLQPELLEAITPDIHLVSTILSLSKVIPEQTKHTARQVVRALVEQLEQKLEGPLRQAIMGALHRAAYHRRPRYADMDWNRTIRANLKHYQPDYKTVIPERRIGHARRRPASRLREIILCVDQSGSMASSVVYASIFAAVMASLPAVKTSLVLFDTAVADLTSELHDPVEVLFGAQLGGGTDIGQALTYCQSLIHRPNDTILILISDLYEGGNPDRLLRRVASLVDAGVQLITLLALSDEGRPSFNHQIAARLVALGIPCFACTPDRFPDLMAAAIKRQDLHLWAAGEGIVTVRAETTP
ncbi:MAG: VWA domain-containing protein [Chloroflexi bacterium]|jgi:Mg-chelatase subunit ChlD|nr:VWA domain-containing protein [Chloroflexota bacterium]